MVLLLSTSITIGLILRTLGPLGPWCALRALQENSKDTLDLHFALIALLASTVALLVCTRMPAQTVLISLFLQMRALACQNVFASQGTQDRMGTHVRPAKKENTRVSRVLNRAQDVILANIATVMRLLQRMHALSARQTRFHTHTQARAQTTVFASRASPSTTPTILCALHASLESTRMLQAFKFAVLAR